MNFHHSIDYSHWWSFLPWCWNRRHWAPDVAPPWPSGDDGTEEIIQHELSTQMVDQDSFAL